uniref:Uncharacterized protein n=1 Tax=Oncorhynchus kisutch TaxID=8019 RepID=A0A8C7N6V8_ONCKI
MTLKCAQELHIHAMLRKANATVRTRNLSVGTFQRFSHFYSFILNICLFLEFRYFKFLYKYDSYLCYAVLFRCNNYIDKWYIGEKCDIEWTILNFALVSSLPGLALAVIVGVMVQCVHYLRKPAKKQKDRTTGVYLSPSSDTANSVESKEFAKNNPILTELWLRCKENSRRGGTKMARLILPLRKFKTRHYLFSKVSLAKRSILNIRYSKCSEQIKGIVHKHWHILRSDDSIGNVFSELPLVVILTGQISIGKL